MKTLFHNALVIANSFPGPRQPMTEEQKKAIFAKVKIGRGGGGGSRSATSPVASRTHAVPGGIRTGAYYARDGYHTDDGRVIPITPEQAAASTKGGTVGVTTRPKMGVKMPNPQDYLDYVRLVENPRRKRQGLPPMSQDEIDAGLEDYMGQFPPQYPEEPIHRLQPVPEPNPIQWPALPISQLRPTIERYAAMNNRSSAKFSVEPTLRLIRNAARSDSVIANAMPITDEQRKAIFAKQARSGGPSSMPSPNVRPPTVVRRAAGAIPQTTITRPFQPPYQEPAVAPVPGFGVRRPAFKDFTHFDTLYQQYRQEFPGEGGAGSRLDAIFEPFRDNPSAILKDKTALDQLEKFIGNAIQPFRGNQPLTQRRTQLETHILAEGLKVLQSAGRLSWYETMSRPNGRGVSFHSRMGTPGYDPYNRPASPPTTTMISRLLGGGTGSKIVRSPAIGGSSKSSPPMTREGGYAPRQDYPGGPVYYGPRPGEQGYIDFDGWRRGEQPQIPGRPTRPDPYITKGR